MFHTVEEIYDSEELMNVKVRLRKLLQIVLNKKSRKLLNETAIEKVYFIGLSKQCSIKEVHFRRDVQTSLSRKSIFIDI